MAEVLSAGERLQSKPLSVNAGHPPKRNPPPKALSGLAHRVTQQRRRASPRAPRCPGAAAPPLVRPEAACERACARPQALYLVHPSARLKLWVLALRLTEPAFYGKATAFLRLRTLAAHMPRPPVPPQHVLDYDRAHG